MSKKKLLADILARPARFYRLPTDVMRDRRFVDSERLDILHAWRGQARDVLAGQAIVSQIETAIAVLESRCSDPLPGHAA